MGTQLRKGFRNIANAGRIAANKELDRDPKIEEGRFQSAILAPMRTVQRVLGDMRNSTLAAIGVIERFLDRLEVWSRPRGSGFILRTHPRRKMAANCLAASRNGMKVCR